MFRKRIFLLLFFEISLAAKESLLCQDSKLNTCKKCLMNAPNCAWCGDDPTKDDIEHMKQRVKCGTKTDLDLQGCKNTISNKTVEERRLSDRTTDTILMKPQKLGARLRLNDPFKFKIEFTSPSHYPIDLYYLMDLSQSMKDDLGNLKNLAKDLFSKMKEITGNKDGNIRIGQGSFVDKTVMPFVSTVPEKLRNPCNENQPCEAPYTFRNNMKLTEDIDEFLKKVDELNSSSNLDAPEAGLDAMMQAIVCDQVIGWDKKRHRLLVYSSDATFHVAGDGKLGGILEPNDMKCHTRGDQNKELYEEANDYDYPSIGQIIDIVNREQILVIFAVTEDQVSTYRQLADLLPSAVVGKLDRNSSNVIGVIEEKYKELKKKVELIWNFPESGLSEDDVEIKVTTNCDGSGFKEGKICEKIEQGQMVEFDVEVIWKKEALCEKGAALLAENPIIFQIFGLPISKSSTELDLKFICDCGCERVAPPSFAYRLLDGQTMANFSCNGAAYTTCGQCDCPSDRTGNMCECESDNTSYDACINPDRKVNADRKVCSGEQSGQCICNKCHCKVFGSSREITGDYCECDNIVCNKDREDRPCGGSERGTCNCQESKCDCKEGWGGPACTCPKSDDQCMNPEAGIDIPCSGKGTCTCDTAGVGHKACSCWDYGPKRGSYQGEFCERFYSVCENYEACIRCVANAARTESLELDAECVSECVEQVGGESYLYVDGVEWIDLATNRAKIAAAAKDRILLPKSALPDKWHEAPVENGKFCIGQDENNCQFYFKFRDESTGATRERNIRVEIQEDRVCPQPPDPLIVAGSILGGVVLLGLIILALIKMIIWWISRREVKEWEKERGKNTITSGHNPLYEAPETRHNVNQSNVKYRPGYKSSAAH